MLRNRKYFMWLIGINFIGIGLVYLQQGEEFITLIPVKLRAILWISAGALAIITSATKKLSAYALMFMSFVIFTRLAALVNAIAHGDFYYIVPALNHMSLLMLIYFISSVPPNSAYKKEKDTIVEKLNAHNDLKNRGHSSLHKLRMLCPETRS